MKMSRSTSGINKRNRKTLEDDNRAESDVGEVKKGPGRGKRSKYAQSYKLDLDDTPLGQRKNGSLAASRRAATPTSNPSQLHKSQSQSQLAASATARTNFKSKKTIKISSVVAQAQIHRRRHLGIFKYDPEVARSDHNQPHPDKFDVSIRPNILPSFTDPDRINCIYTVKVSSMWLRSKERQLIVQDQNLWGSGIYTDDSDPVAAAMHSGFIACPRPNDAVLERLIEEQNPKIEGLAAPDKPAPVPEGKDLHITLVVLPQLESYADSVRFGIKSRNWPGPTPGVHDGVSYMVLKTEFLEDGIMNRRIGRTGVEKRKRLRQEMADRKRSFELRDEMIAKHLKDKTQRQRALLKILEAPPIATRSNDPLDDASEKENQLPASSDAAHKTEEPTTLEGIGQSPNAWIKQLNDSASTADVAAVA